MFEYVGPKKADKDQVRTRVITVIVTLIGAALIFGLLYWAASSGI